MNLHEHSIHTKLWLWLDVYNGRGTMMGTHAWQVVAQDAGGRETWPDPEGTPNFNQYAWTSRLRRYQEFNPFAVNANNLLTSGWIRPLCGQKSRSLHPWGQLSGWRLSCTDCADAAAERGILVHRYNMMNHQSISEYRQAQAMHATMLQAGNTGAIRR